MQTLIFKLGMCSLINRNMRAGNSPFFSIEVWQRNYAHTNTQNINIRDIFGIFQFRDSFRTFMANKEWNAYIQQHMDAYQSYAKYVYIQTEWFKPNINMNWNVEHFYWDFFFVGIQHWFTIYEFVNHSKLQWFMKVFFLCHSY